MDTMEKCEDFIEKELKKLKNLLKDNLATEYTGFTTRCRKCNQEVNCKRNGYDEENHCPMYSITCGCKKGD